MRLLDLLAEAILEAPELKRQGQLFTSETPWTVARYGRFALGRGWWVFECDGEGAVEDIELRLRSLEDGLLAFSLRRDPVGKVFFHSDRVFDVSVLVSAWPGRLSLKTLRLRRLEPLEVIQLFGMMLSRLARSGRPVSALAHFVTRALGGRTLRVRAKQRPANPPIAPVAEPSATLRSLSMDSLTVVLREDESLHPRAIKIVTDAFARAPALLAVYGDVLAGGQIHPQPSWDPDLAAVAEFVSSPIFFRGERSVDTSWRDLRELSAYPGAVARIALPLAIGAKVAQSQLNAPAVPMLARTPTVSVIIPTKIKIDLLERCLASLADQTAYPGLDVVIINNGADHPKFADVITAASARMNLQVVDDFGSFNFSRLINSGVRNSKGEVILMLNDDVEAIEPGWLHRMVESVTDPGVGCVGARLLFADGSIQHAGVTLGISGVCGHLWRGLRQSQAAGIPQIMLPSGRMAVTGACLAVRRDVFDQAGGLDEVGFPVAYNDIDFCLRVRALGYRTVYRGDAALIHHESQSRGSDDATAEKRQRVARETRVFLERWGHALEDDPFGSPAFDPTSESGAVHPSLTRDE